MPKSTVNDWFHGPLPPEIRYLICALERLSEPSRLQLLREWCRTCPRLDDARLAHDPKTVEALKALATTTSGLTIVAGPNHTTSTFLITALGHWAERTAQGKGIQGLDLHTPCNFVPVDGVLYLAHSAALDGLAGLVSQILVGMAQSPSQLCLFNGVWDAFPSTRDSIMQLGKGRHVVTTCRLIQSGIGMPTTLVTVTEDSRKRLFIKIEANRLRS